MMRKRNGWKVPVMLGAALLVAVPSFVAAQGGDGFLFKQPVLSIGIRTGVSVPRASSDIFAHTFDQLTLGKSDFAAGYFGAEIAVRVSDRVDLAFGAGHSGSSTRSEFRDWVDADDLPIEQTTDLAVNPVTMSVKYYLSDRGRSVGRFAWIPNKVNTYVGGGAGITWYRFEQRGDWVDFETLDIFNTRFKSNGSGASVHALAGVDVALTKFFFLTGEGRYSWARGALDEFSFEGFDKMDLYGLQFAVGFSARF